MTEAVAAWRRKAVDLLARREYSRAELARKLAGREADIDHAALDTVLDELAACGWQSDARFAQMWIQAHAARHGAQRLRQDLRQRGVATADIDAALAEHRPLSQSRTSSAALAPPGHANLPHCRPTARTTPDNTAFWRHAALPAG